MKVRLHQGGFVKECKIGVSWTLMFFYGFVPLFRRDWKMLFVMLLVPSILDQLWAGIDLRFYHHDNAYSYIGFRLGGMFWLFMFVMYNRIHIRGLLKKGYLPVDSGDMTKLVDEGFLDDFGMVQPLFRKLKTTDVRTGLALIIVAIIITVVLPLIGALLSGNFDPRLEVLFP